MSRKTDPAKAIAIRERRAASRHEQLRALLEHTLHDAHVEAFVRHLQWQRERHLSLAGRDVAGLMAMASGLMLGARIRR